MGPVEAHESTCQIKAELLYSYQSSLAEYSRTVTFLYKHMGTLPKRDYDEINAFCERARQDSEAARLDLDGHIAEHGC
jgi:hypothetical protein